MVWEIVEIGSAIEKKVAQLRLIDEVGELDPGSVIPTSCGSRCGQAAWAWLGGVPGSCIGYHGKEYYERVREQDGHWNENECSCGLGNQGSRAAVGTGQGNYRRWMWLADRDGWRRSGSLAGRTGRCGVLRRRWAKGNAQSRA